jgi:serum/glucocorticoid-regulated kinase 2
MEPNFEDRLGWAMDADILKIIGDEIIYYSNKILKYNSFSMKQERSFLLTNKCLYNILNKKVKREMKYEEMLGITFSNQTNEFIIHANLGYDFHFISPDKILIIFIISKCYENLTKKPIILCEVKEKSLKSYVTTKRDKRRNSAISRLDEKNKIDTQTFIIDNDPLEISKRSNTEVFGGKISIVGTIVEDEKGINSEIIYSNDDQIQEINFSDFEIVDIIGKGTTGKVLLAKNRINNEYYALKSIDKKILDIEESSYIIFIKNLKKLIKNLKFPFLIRIDFCFETDDRIYFVFPYIQGEELLYNLEIFNNLNEEKVKFYSGIIGLTLDFLHNNGIEYKLFDSKNILIDKIGYLNLVPFHLGKILNLKNNADTKKILKKYKNEYCPPEIFQEGNTINKKSADWWNLGVIIYEMIYSIPPFYSDDDSEMENMITNNELQFPNEPQISDVLKDLITKLLNKNYEERLGYQNGFEEIKQHEFFKDFNFDELLNKTIQAPYIPNIGDTFSKNKKIKMKFKYGDLKNFGIINDN